jgi:hypothetical protein
MMSEELRGLDVQLDKISFPASGSTTFFAPSEDSDELEEISEFSAVILFHHTLRTHYKGAYTGEKSPPDCMSLDGETGEGDPGGVCRTCPMNQWDTGPNGAKACKVRRRVFILREGEIFPMLLSLPTGSLRELTRYLKRMMTKGRKSNSVVTHFSIRKAANTKGAPFPQAAFRIERLLTPEEIKPIEQMSEQMKAYSQQIGFEYDADADVISDADEDVPPPLS